MNDIFKDMQAKVGCEYLSDLPSYKRGYSPRLNLKHQQVNQSKSEKASHTKGLRDV